MKVYVIIPHYIFTDELKELATQAIKSFKDTTDVTIVSVDDMSPLNTDFLREISDIYIRLEKRGGFAKTCNTGFRRVLENEKEDCYIVCANNDIEVYPLWFERFKEATELGQADAVGGLGYREKKDIENYEANSSSQYFSNSISEGGRFDDWLFPGGFFMTTKKVMEEVGLFDENFLNGYEDVDLFLRFKQAGKRLIMTPKVAYWHKEGATRFNGVERGLQRETESKNLKYFMDKWQFKSNQNILHFLIDNRIQL